VALLAEYDALPELGHGCGHNLIAAASLGGALAAAEALRAAEEAWADVSGAEAAGAERAVAAAAGAAGAAGKGRIPGKLLLLGTPAEERGGGKVVMAEAGVFEDIDAVMMVHPATRSQLARNGLASRTLRIAFHGKASHAAAAPEKGINALDALIQTYNSINALRQQTADFTRIHGVITRGGDAANIIPDFTEAKFLVRALDDGECEKLTERVIACAQGAETATGARLEYENSKNCDAVKNNMPLARAFARNAERVGVVFDRDEPNEELGSTDMGNVSSLTAAIHPFLEIGHGEPAVHTVEFREAAASEEGLEMMLKAAKILGATAVDFLLDEELRRETAAAREETREV
jgi:amidohydrolase